MSSQKGNAHRQRPQKHRNETQFDPIKHTSKKKEKELVELKPKGVCQRCYDIIGWKVKYKKYKQITQPAKCVKCGQKNVRRSYYVLCDLCISSSGACGKCCEVAELVIPITEKEDAAVQREIQAHVDSLSERKRRTFYRYVEREQSQAGNECGCCEHNEHESHEHSHSRSACVNGKASQLLAKLKAHHEDSSGDDDDDEDYDDSGSDCGNGCKDEKKKQDSDADDLDENSDGDLDEDDSDEQ